MIGHHGVGHARLQMLLRAVMSDSPQYQTTCLNTITKVLYLKWCVYVCVCVSVCVCVTITQTCNVCVFVCLCLCEHYTEAETYKSSLWWKVYRTTLHF